MTAVTARANQSAWARYFHRLPSAGSSAYRKRARNQRSGAGRNGGGGGHPLSLFLRNCSLACVLET